MGRGVAVAATVTMMIPILLVTPTAAAAETPDCSTVSWMDTTASPQRRAEALLAAFSAGRGSASRPASPATCRSR